MVGNACCLAIIFIMSLLLNAMPDKRVKCDAKSHQTGREGGQTTKIKWRWA